MLTVITGPPCSGKSTCIRQRSGHGDIIIDLDILAQALGSRVGHGHLRHIKSVALAARKAAIQEAIQQHHKGETVWIVDGNPSDPQRRAYRHNGARIIDLSADKAELHRRATAANRPSEWHRLIDEWK